MRFSFTALAVLLIIAVLPATAGVIGNWEGSGRSWNNPDFTEVKDLMTIAGNTVRANQDLISAITGSNVLVIGEAVGVPTASELTALTTWVNLGGVVLMFGDSGGSGAPANNAIAAALGSTMQQQNDFVNFGGTIQGGVFATAGLEGLVFTSTPASTITGGNEIQSNLARWEGFGSGFLFMIGDRIDHNVNMAPGNTNFLFLQNIANCAVTAPIPQPNPEIPEPATTALLGGGILVLALYRRFARR
jgi:hypothetical protein